jgi:hypothetical protein
VDAHHSSVAVADRPREAYYDIGIEVAGRARKRHPGGPGIDERKTSRMKCTICGKGAASRRAAVPAMQGCAQTGAAPDVQELPHYRSHAIAPVDRYGTDTGPSKRTKALRRSEQFDNGGRMLLGAVAAVALVVAAYVAERELTSRAEGLRRHRGSPRASPPSRR